ncbi:unnamed protein product [Camellia sinensis]
MVDVAKALARPASYITKYFGCELGAQSKFDEQTGVSLVNGSHDTAKLVGLLENFIKKYVQCYGCGNPETEVLITKSQMVQLRCAVCGFVSDVDMRDKLTAFILKNPPEPKKDSKDKKAMRKAEKERLKEGEAVDEEQKKPKKVVKNKGSSTSKDGPAKASSNKKKASGSDEDQSSPTLSQVDEKEETDDDNDNEVQWQTDTSLEAARQRIEEQLSSVTADMVMLSTNEPVNNKSKETNRAHESTKIENPSFENGNSNHKKLVEEAKAKLKKGVSANEFQSIFGSFSGSGLEIMTALFEALFDGVEKGFAKEVTDKKGYLVAAVAQDDDES